MTHIHLEALPSQSTKGEVLHLITEVGGLASHRVGKIDLHGAHASIEVPEDWVDRLVRILDGSSVRHRRIRARRGSAAAATGATEDHFQRLRRLLDLESRAEMEQALTRAQRVSGEDAERSGLSLVDLAIADEYAGLGGRTILSLKKRNRSQNLPWHRLTVGSPVILSAGTPDSEPRVRGIVCDRGENHVAVAFDEAIDDPEELPSWRLDACHDEVARLRQQAALDQAGAARGDRRATLRRVLLGEQEPSFNPVPALQPLDPGLNSYQRDVVSFALSANDIALVHGPPGTGKTRTLAEIIRQAIRRGDRVLACAPSNLAVDNLFERLIEAGERAVRIGHPARVLPALQAHTLDLLVEEHEQTLQARQLMREARLLRRQAGKFTRAKPEPGARRDMRSQAKELIADARRREAQAVDSILDSADALCATTTALDSALLGQREFDLGVIDEACQSTEPGCWIPILRCRRVILAGDHCQLPPTVVSREAQDAGFGVSLFERLVDLYGTAVARRLRIQYRMHQSIMDFSSMEFYEAELEADPSVREHRICDLPGVRTCPYTESPCCYVDTAGADYEEEIEPDGESRWNRKEADLVCRRVAGLLDAGVPPTAIGVITPYAAQVRLLQNQLQVPGLEIDSVDGFQGREKEAIVISLVRSNRTGEIGFLEDIRRMNVALTRARRSLTVIGDSATLSVHPFYAELLRYFESLGAYHTVWDEGPDE
jgi:hypothetical protein